MQHNSFFQRNTIKDIAVEHFPSSIRERSKRSSSVTALKLNPSKFQHREVFDNRIYDKISFMKLDIKELKEREQDKDYAPSAELNKVISALAQMLQEEGLLQSVTNFHNHCALMVKHQVRKDFIHTVNQIVVSLLRKITAKVEQMASFNKSNQQKIAFYDSKIRRQMEALGQSRKSTRKLQKEKDLQQKINQLDFALKKEMLKVDQLQQKLREQSKLNVSLAESIKTMQIEKNAQTSYRQSMEYKVKRLKEELQVAHIIKEQNLADKMKYIMNW